MRIRVLGIVLAGGKGTRLAPLTNERAKPAVPFGGKYRIVDFVLSNFINSGIYSIYVLTQFRSQSLLQHLSEGWQFGSLLKNQFVIPVPAQMRSEDETWYQGTADAIYQNINLVEQADPHVVAIFGGDHIYRMNIASMIEYHVEKRAEVTVAAIPTPKKHAAEFGVIEADDDDRILAFHEKNPDAPTMPADGEQVFASMGNYIFSTRALLDLLRQDAKNPTSHHDFGKDILPTLAGNGRMYAYNFQTNRIPGEPADSVPYWRDVGTIDAYYEANMDLRYVSPALNLYNREWPLRSTILSGGVVRNSVLGRGVRVHAGALVEDCVIMDNCDIGRRAKVRGAILDKNVRVLEDSLIGYDLEADRARGYHITDSGLVVIAGERSHVDITGLVV
jgi:glucose-1-phosphate adenylyltransferase